MPDNLVAVVTYLLMLHFVKPEGVKSQAESRKTGQTVGLTRGWG